MAADSNWRNMRLHQLPWLEVGRQRWPGWLRRNNLLINNCRICRICWRQNINLLLRHLTSLRSHWHIPSFSPCLRPALDIILKTLLNHNGNHSNIPPPWIWRDLAEKGEEQLPRRGGGAGEDKVGPVVALLPRACKLGTAWTFISDIKKKEQHVGLHKISSKCQFLPFFHWVYLHCSQTEF